MNIAIVTGASSGIGKEFVKALETDKKTDEIWAIARNETKLETLKNTCKKKIRTFSVDVSDAAAVAEFGEVLKSEDPNVTYLVNSAGWGKFCRYDDLSIEESLSMIETNCNGLIDMTLTTLPYMQRGAHIINVGSQAAFQPVPYQNLYSASKALVRSYSRALNVELKDRGICVTCVCPSWVKTNFFETAMEENNEKSKRNLSGMVTPEVVVKRAMKDAKRNKDMSVPNVMTKINHLLAKFLPQSVVMQIWLKQQHL